MPDLERIGGLLQSAIDAGAFTGVQLAVELRGESLELCLGEASVGEPMSPGHLLPWLSAGKPLTAIAWAQLWQAGRIGLDDPIVEHIPEFGQRGKAAITYRHLLTHTGGFRSMVDVDSRQPDWAAEVDRVCRARLERDWILGRRAGYQARGSWYILGETLQRLTGRPLADIVRVDICEPAGLEDVWLEMPAQRFSDYGSRIGELFDTTDPSNPISEEDIWGPDAAGTCVPGTSARGPMRDLCRLYATLLRRDGTILLPPTLDAMVARQRSGLFDETFRHSLDWGLGFVLDSNHHGADTVPYGYGRHASSRAFGHAGARCVSGFADPESELAVALGVNGRLAQTAHVDQFREFLTAIYEDLEIPGSDLMTTMEST